MLGCKAAVGSTCDGCRIEVVIIIIVLIVILIVGIQQRKMPALPHRESGSGQRFFFFFEQMDGCIFTEWEVRWRKGQGEKSKSLGVLCAALLAGRRLFYFFYDYAQNTRTIKVLLAKKEVRKVSCVTGNIGSRVVLTYYPA